MLEVQYTPAQAVNNCSAICYLARIIILRIYRGYYTVVRTYEVLILKWKKYFISEHSE